MRSLFKAMFSARKDFEPRIPDGQRVYAIGDIHGRIDLLQALHERLYQDLETALADGKEAKIVYLGDYIDRGSNSKEVIDYLSGEWPSHVQPVFLRGNHEATLLRFLDDANVLTAWRNFGGLETLLSYGVDLSCLRSNGGLPQIQENFKTLLPETHRYFFENLQTKVTIGDYLFVHAGIRPGVAPENQKEEDLLWIRDEFLDSRLDHGKIVVHGHSPSEQPEIWPNRINIDTGAYLTGNLTCLVLEGGGRHCL